MNYTAILFKKLITKKGYMNVFRELDHIILGIPAIVCSSFGVGGRFLEQSQNKVVHATGWLGCRAAIVLSILSGLPLIIYSFAKALLGKALNAITMERFVCLKDFKEHAEIQLNVTLITVSALPLIILSLPTVIPAAITAYKTYKEFAKAIQAVKDSDLFKTLQDLYYRLKGMNQLQQKEDMEEA